MTAIIDAVLATTWLCTSPLTLDAGPLQTPMSAVTLTLWAEADGRFASEGTSRLNATAARVTWTGQWSAIEDGLARIGSWQHSGTVAEMRGFSTIAEHDVLLLDLQESETSGVTLRCLERIGNS